MKAISFFLLSCVLFLSSCFSYKELEIGDVQDVKFNKLNGDESQLNMQAGLHIKNPNGYKIKIKRIEADMFLNGKNAGKMTLAKKIVLPRHSEQLQTFTVNAELSDLLSLLPAVMFGGDINVQLKGNIYGKVFIFRKKLPLEAEQKISLKDLKGL
jgi:LEA14-like dessication related protein